jgi:heme exporter protein CcmD
MPEFQFDGVADFLSMGGYALFVWASYGFFAVVMGFNLWLPYRQRVKVLRLLQARQARQQEQSPIGSDAGQQQRAQQQQGEAH